MEVDLPFGKFIIKPILATLIMGICSYSVFMFFDAVHPGRIGIIISILVAVLIYAISLVLLKIFTKEEILMIPYGNKIYKFLEKTGLYKETANLVK